MTDSFMTGIKTVHLPPTTAVLAAVCTWEAWLAQGEGEGAVVAVVPATQDHTISKSNLNITLMLSL